MKTPIWRLIAALCCTALLSGCGGSGDDDDFRPDTTSRLNGVYSGSFSNDDGEFDLFAMAYEGLLFAYSDAAARQHGGTIQGRDDEVFVIYGLFDETGENFANAEAQGVFVPHESIDADYFTTEGEVGEIALDIDPVWDNPASFSLVGGAYTHTDGDYVLTVTIDEFDGTLDGSDTDGCFYDGVVLPPESDRNLYIVEMTQAAGCRGEPEEVDILGYATLFDNSPDPDELFTLVLAESTNSNDEFMLTLHLLRQAG